MMSWFRVFFASVWMLSISCVSMNSVADSSDSTGDISRGLAWLSSQQQADGSFRNNVTTATDWQASTEALQAFATAEQLNQLNTQALAAYLAGLNIPETELLSRRISASLLLGQPFTDDLATLELRQNSNGGFGDEDGFDSSVYDTLFALQVLANNSQNNQQLIYYAIEYLKGQQQSDGSFLLEGNLGSTSLTAQTLVSLRPYLFRFDVGSMMNRAQDYLLNHLDAQNSAESWEIAQVLLAIIPLTTDPALYQSALDRLSSRQLSDGSWSQDAFSTALAVKALQQLQDTAQITDPAQSALTGIVLSQNTLQPMINVRVTLTGGSVSVLSSSDGHFSVTNIQPGDFALTYESDGYYPVTQSGKLNEGQRIDLGSVLLTPIPDFGVIRGQITDASSANPLPGVQVTLSGEASASTLTDAEGYFHLVSSPGEITLTASMIDYVSASGSAALQAGTELVFSPALYSAETEPPEPPEPLVQVTGLIVDSSTMKPIEGATVSINQSTFTTESGEGGSFTISHIPIGMLHIQVEAQGYATVEEKTLVTQEGNMDIGVLVLQPDIPGTLTDLHGQIIDAESQQGIPYSQLQITQLDQAQEADPQVIFVNTDAQGFYQIDDIGFLAMELFAQADGFQSQVQTLKLNEHRRVTQDVTLTPFSAGGVTIPSLLTDDSTYGAYRPVNLTATLLNNGDAARRVQLRLGIFDNNNDVIQQISIGTDVDASGASLPVTLLPGVPVDVIGQWFTGDTPPDNYRLTLSVFDAMNGQILGEKLRYISIESEQHIESSELLASPRISRVGASETLSFAVRIRYTGNTEATYALNYDLLDPNGQPLLQRSEPLHLKPGDTSRLIQLPPEPLLFSQGGRFLLQAEIENQSLYITPAWITVAPATRIELSQELTPAEVLPGDDRLLNVEILLQGVEQP